MNYFRKAISLLLSLLMLCCCFPAGMSVSAEAAKKPLPTIYIKGQGTMLVKQAHKSNSGQIYPVEFPDGYWEEVAKKAAGPLSFGLISDQWEEYNELLYEEATSFTEPFRCDENGDVSNGSGSMFSSGTRESVVLYSSTQASSGLPVWNFDYDWREDPIKVAGELHTYIQTVKSKTKAEKVNIVARCLGGDIMLAYFNAYGAKKDINDCIFCSVGFDGFESMEAIFTGSVVFDGKSVERFTTTYLQTDDYADDPLFETLGYLAACLNYGPVLGFTADMLQKVYIGIRDDSLKRILRESVAGMPGCWAYIGDECYEQAKSYIFEGAEDEYKGLIEKIDAFHNDILVRYNEILDEAEQNGARFYNICKYGIQLLPVMGNYKGMADSILSTERSSLGATCSTLTGSLSDSYLAGADERFVSPDKQIDASTCKYPEHTWFIKNISHKNMPACIDYIYKAILEDEGYTTVFDLEDYPQFLMASDDNQTIFPATAENSMTQDGIEKSPLDAVILLLMRVIVMLVQLLTTVIKNSK